jgi:hypothetical protein
MKKDREVRPPLGYADKIQLTISYLLKAIVVFTIIMSIVEFNPFLIASSLVILVFSAMPALIERTFRITLPVEVDLTLTAFVFAHFMLGEVEDYYTRFWFFDLILHSSSGIVIGLVGFVIMYFFLYSSRVTANPLLVSVLSVSFSLAAGALWEIFEFGMDQLFGFNMQKSGNIDTMSDLIVDFLGASVVGIGVYRYLTRDVDGLVKLTINRFIQYNMKLRDRRMLRKLRKETGNVIPRDLSDDISRKLDQSQ